MSVPVKVVLAIAVAWAMLALAAYLGQRRLMYFPSRERVPPAAAGLAGVAEKVLVAPDGARVIAWHGRAAQGRPTLLYFHGNGGSLVQRAERVRRFMGAGLGVYMMTYRGYGGSSGAPSEAANSADARLAYDALLAEGVAWPQVILYGESLGTAIAARLALERQAAGLVLEAPFTSAVDVGVRAYPFLPVSLLLKDRYETRQRIAEIAIPLLILHGERDATVPVAMGRELFSLARAPKRMAIFADGGHSDLYLGDNGALPVLEEWIAGLGP
jgi:fermentation-respiration switch protein FrsA (DUF1100 family)